MHDKAYTLALEELEQVLRRDPTCLAARNARANALGGAGRGGEAIVELQALLTDGAQPRAVFLGNLALQLQELGRRGEAEAYYRKAIQDDPDRANVHCNLANCLAEEERWDEAMQEYEVALALNSHHRGAIVNSQVIARLRNAAQMVMTHPDSAPAHFMLGDLFAQTKWWAKAAREFRAALAVVPGWEEPLCALSRVLCRLRDKEGALDAAAAAVAVAKTSVNARIALGLAFAHADRRDEALEALREALQLDPDSAEVHQQLGFVLWMVGNLREARAEYARAVELDPDSLERRTELQVFLTAKVLADPEDDDFALKAQNLSAMGMPKSADDLKRAVMQRPRLNDDDPARRGNLAL